MNPPLSQPLVSIIIPVHNAAQLLPACFDALARQTYPHLEFWLVDDASTDASAHLCQAQAEADSRFHLLRMPKQQGAGDARQAGISASAGSLIGFCDADDTVAPTLWAKLSSLMERNDSDIVCCNSEHVFPDGRRRPVFPVEGPVEVLDAAQALLRLHRHKGIGYSLCDKLFRRELMEAVLMRSRPFEEQAYMYRYFGQARRVTVTPEPLYHCHLRPGHTPPPPFSLEREYALFELFDAETRYVMERCGVDDLNTVVRKGVHLLHHAMLLPATPQTEALCRKVEARMRQYRHLSPRQLGPGWWVGRFLATRGRRIYRPVYRWATLVFKPSKFRYITGQPASRLS